MENDIKGNNQNVRKKGNKSGFFEKFNKIDKTPARLMKQSETQIINIRNGREHISTDSTYIKMTKHY